MFITFDKKIIMAELFEKLHLEGVGKIIVIASGKGGVGKSTVAANLAVSLARNGYRTALVDADIYGPTIPRMFGVESVQPAVTALGDKEMIFPIEKFGVKIMSIGFFVEPHQSLIWRGPMASSAMTQLFENTSWGETDYMVVDLPPGTGDIQLTIVQKLELAGAIIVTTPQGIALNDVRKAASMFANPEIKVPLFGVVENMSWFSPEKHPEEKYFLFGEGGGRQIANEYQTTLLGQVPLVMEVGEAAEHGRTIFNISNTVVSSAFERITQQVVKAVEAGNPA